MTLSLYHINTLSLSSQIMYTNLGSPIDIDVDISTPPPPRQDGRPRADRNEEGENQSVPPDRSDGVDRPKQPDRPKEGGKDRVRPIDPAPIREEDSFDRPKEGGKGGGRDDVSFSPIMPPPSKEGKGGNDKNEKGGKE